MSDQKPHTLHLEFFDDLYDILRPVVDCPYDPDDEDRPCALVDIEKDDRPPISGCGVWNWLEAGGAEVLNLVEPIQIEVSIDVAWMVGYEGFEVRLHDGGGDA